MAKYFTFVDRFVPVDFFEGDDSVRITLTIGDDMDKKIDECAKKAAKITTTDAKRAVLVDWIGEENTDKLLSHFDCADGYVMEQLIGYIRVSYIEAKAKNVQAAAQGRQ